ncbi:MAG: mannose-6-phosphate isomerase [Acholeplasmataceae bacterium]|nr:mannose-6-phosphate isomerase [Acholeplasmataceae bacterium]
MAYLNFKSQYDRFPETKIERYQDQAFENAEAIVRELQKICSGIVCFEIYPGCNKEKLYQSIINKLEADRKIDVEEYTKPAEELEKQFAYNLTEDRVFGVYSHHTIEDYYDLPRLEKLKKELKNTTGLIITYGFGASLLPYDHLVLVSITRWEIQLRYREGLTNFKVNNPNEDNLRKYKRGYFLEWRVADRIKEKHFLKAEYLIDDTDRNTLKMVTKTAYEYALDYMVRKPFRMVPYFDPGVWGGQWMKEVCNLDPSAPNYAWCFDGVPEENSIRYRFNNTLIEFPAQDLLLYRARTLLGDRVHGRFGKQFPIRFDLLDTMDGENLSLQVHPLTEYIQDKFGMTYTQDESYYIMDAEEDGTVYLGLKENINPEAMKADLLASQTTGEFDAEKYVNVFPVKKHDHISIPGGTVHCSGRNTLVLEISACVYIFTFKLWDWGRLGLDGKPRPVHLEHGFNSIQFDRNTSWVKKNLINPLKRLNDYEEITGLHEREFLETRRYTFTEAIEIPTFGSVNMGNLVQGEAAIIESVDGSFEPLEIHYAETFVIPASIGSFRIYSKDSRQECKIIMAHVR